MGVRDSPAANKNTPPRIFFSRDPGSHAARTEAVKAGLQELGYTDGQNLKIEYRFAHGKRERFPHLAAELVRLKVDLIVVAGGTPSVQEAQKATKQIPIMSGGGADPVEMGLVQSVAQPGGNVTGVTNSSGELGGKRLELLKEVVPEFRVSPFYTSQPIQAVSSNCNNSPECGACLKLMIFPLELRTGEDFDKAFSDRQLEWYERTARALGAAARLIRGGPTRAQYEPLDSREFDKVFGELEQCINKSALYAEQRSYDLLHTLGDRYEAIKDKKDAGCRSHECA